MSEEAKQLISLLAITVADIQAAAQERLERRLNVNEVEAVVNHLRLRLGRHIAWPALLQQCIEEVESHERFTKWLKLVDKAVWGMAGCSMHDLPDLDYYSLFAVGSTPAQAADAVLLSVGFSRFE